MRIELSSDTQEMILKEVSRGRFATADELVRASVQAWREQNALPYKKHVGYRSPEYLHSQKERSRALAQWAESHPDTPPLSDDAISRTNLNPDRW